MPRPSIQPSEPQEQQLLQRIAQQDRAALETLYHAYHRRLSRFLGRLAPRHDFADEIINDTFWIVWQKAGEFRGASRVSTWIMGIAYRRALRALRDERQSLATEALAPEAQSVDPRDFAGEADLQDWISSGLRHLSPEQRLTLELAYYLGLSCEEIATITGCAVGTVKARMFHARERLREALPILGGSTPRGAP